MNKTSLLLCLALFIGLFPKANPADTTIAKKKYFTQRVNGIINLDGIPNEEAWNAVGWGITDFSANGRNIFLVKWTYRFLR